MRDRLTNAVVGVVSGLNTSLLTNTHPPSFISHRGDWKLDPQVPLGSETRSSKMLRGNEPPQVFGCADAINSARPHTTALRDVTLRVIDGPRERERPPRSPRSPREGAGRR
ncbi:hypothetical protein EVAR_27874_1 [Eumeta japonica]|uniref:Uncharacterized protein n=1 Tax=Eumeta variegata TaxID=151549 RepID=A0A4C1VIA9_EUMVA|nr:hypothetical protein EVAR_27874_1 [Eumeta japonica]